jgi:hypothetical protein
VTKVWSGRDVLTGLVSRDANQGLVACSDARATRFCVESGRKRHIVSTIKPLDLALVLPLLSSFVRDVISARMFRQADSLPAYTRRKPMRTPYVKTLTALVMLTVGSTMTVFAADVLDVKIIDRQDNSGRYTYIVPGYATANSDTNANCRSTGACVNCIASTTTTAVGAPAFAASYAVTGATLSLQLPDGRVAVVNCESKANWTEWSKPNAHRSCRVPLVSSIQSEFDGDKAKLMWPVSIDGKKKESETYKILAVLDRR